MPQVSPCLLPEYAKEKTEYHCFPKGWERGFSACGAVNGRAEGGGFSAGAAIQLRASPGGRGCSKGPREPAGSGGVGAYQG